MRAGMRGTAVALSVVMLVAACTGGGGEGDDPSATEAPAEDRGEGCGELNMAFNFDMQVPDPDIFYQADGLNVVRGAYEGLLRYKPNTELPEIDPLLAASYDVSDDGLTYTFELREGVKFHDGTDLDAQAVIDSFERRVDVDAGPAYMLFGVDRYEAPDANTLVIHLEKPDSAFIHYLASPYGPVAISPAVLENEAVDGDSAQGFLATNSAGTGPYRISSFQPGAYELEAFDDYWGTDPYPPACFETVKISIVPDFTTQMLELERGDLDLMIHGVSKADLPRFEDAGYSIFRHQGINRVTMHLNTHDGPFSDPAIRAAIPAAIDRSTIVEQVWGEGAVVAEHSFPRGMLPEGVGTYDVELDPSQLAAAVDAGGWGDTTIDLTYTTDDPVNEQLAGLIASQLTAGGLNTTARGVTQPETFEYPTTPGIRPDALVLPATPDAAHPFTWSDLFYTPGGGLAYFAADVCAEGDELSIAGLDAVSDEDIVAAYAEAAQAYQDCGAFVPIADVAETVVGIPGMSGFEHEFNSLWALRLASLRLDQ